MINSYIATAGA